MKVKIKALRRTEYPDLMETYELPMQAPCETVLGTTWISVDGQKPEGLCNEAWSCMKKFVEELAAGGGHFFGDWMKNPHAAMVSCNDGFRPVTYLVETVEE